MKSIFTTHRHIHIIWTKPLIIIPSSHLVPFSTPRYLSSAAAAAAASSLTRPSEKYLNLVKDGRVNEDAAQLDALRHMDRLYDEILTYKPVAESWTGINKSTTTPSSTTGWFSSLIPSSTKTVSQQKQQSSSIQVAPRGLYIHGGPGSGKTFLMDLFHDTLPIQGKRRMHFHEFMLEVHRTLHDLQKRGIKGNDMMDRCVETLRRRAWVLFFDEFQVTDIADAMVMRRLFESLFRDAGLIMVATSNREPDELYKNGLQRDLFVPFIDELKTRCRFINMQTGIDYRLVASLEFEGHRKVDNAAATTTTTATTTTIAPEDTGVYIVSDQTNLKADAKFERLWEKLCKGDSINDLSLRVQGRSVPVPLAARHTDVARFSFDDLCGHALGAVDYYAIAATFHTVFVDGIPRMGMGDINRIRRVITMIDTFYDQGVVLILKARVPMKDLLDVDSFNNAKVETDVIGSSTYVPQNIDEVFAFARTLSRLQEMQTPAYLQKVANQKRGEKQSAVRFFSQFSLEREHSSTLLSEGDARMIFDRYDVNDDNVLDMKKELPMLMEDVTLFTSGHRHVSEEALRVIGNMLDPKGTGTVDWDRFKNFACHGGTSLFDMVKNGGGGSSEMSQQVQDRL